MVKGQIDIFEGWCKPAHLPSILEYADHTFVYCRNNQKYFLCWGTGDIKAKDAAKVCQGRGIKAYCKADNYRVSFPNAPDTAGLGIYGINGVCHQSANLFLYPVNKTLPLTGKRPRGILISHMLYGVYGTLAPGFLSSAETKFKIWYKYFYIPALLKCFFYGLIKEKENNNKNSYIDKIIQLHSENLNKNTTMHPHQIIIKELEILLDYYYPNLKINSFKDIHKELLEDKDKLILSSGINMENLQKGIGTLPDSNEIEKLAENINDLVVQFQKTLFNKLGKRTYREINGDTNAYKLIDPTIMRGFFDSINE